MTSTSAWLCAIAGLLCLLLTSVLHAGLFVLVGWVLLLIALRYPIQLGLAKLGARSKR